MVLKNFRTLFLLTTCWIDGDRSWIYEVGHYVYYKDMRGNIQDASTDGARVSFDTELRDPYTTNPYQFLYPAIRNDKNDSNWLRQIKDYDNLEDMIKSTDFWIHGTREHFHDDLAAGTGMIILGSGDTPPTPDDYKLDSWIPTTELSVQSFDCFCFTKTEQLEQLNERIGAFQTTFKNMTNENKTVKEVGLMRDAFDNKKSESFRTERTKVLFIRNVLDSPVIVKPGELYTFTLTLN
jgi:hypothetical protein